MGCMVVITPLRPVQQCGAGYAGIAPVPVPDQIIGGAVRLSGLVRNFQRRCPIVVLSVRSQDELNMIVNGPHVTL